MSDKIIKILSGEIIEDDGENFHTCELCRSTYPIFDETIRYYSVEVFGKEHIFCNECLEHLRLITFRKMKV